MLVGVRLHALVPLREVIVLLTKLARWVRDANLNELLRGRRRKSLRVLAQVPIVI